MVSDVRPPPPPPLLVLLLSSPPPQAATPSARAVTRQPEAARERARKFPSSRNAIPIGPANLSKRGDVAQRTVRRRLRQVSRLPGRYGARMRAVAPRSTSSTVIMNESIAL